MFRLARMRMGAPALVMLATVVNAAAAGGEAAIPASLERVCPNLSWPAGNGAARASLNTRVLLAQNAATTIRCLDRLSGATHSCQNISLTQFEPVVHIAAAESAVRQTCFSTESTHQHSAP